MGTRATRSPRRCWPTAFTWSRAVINITVGAASIAQGRKNPTRWCSCASVHKPSPIRAPPWSSCLTAWSVRARTPGPRCNSTGARSTSGFPRCCPRGSTTRPSCRPQASGCFTSGRSARQRAQGSPRRKTTRTSTPTNTRTAMCSWWAVGRPACRRHSPQGARAHAWCSPTSVPNSADRCCGKPT